VRTIACNIFDADYAVQHEHRRIFLEQLDDLRL
jgi:hypothetical protein